ncbi:MAG: SRPBCC domain-containing protein [Bacteroidetes bacterium]|nr:SRPBCC domain-containing protein [Bacteroidota bacterium]
MENQDFTATVKASGSPQEVFECICDIPKWWTKDFEGAGARLDDEFVICHPGAHYSKQRVVESIPGEKLVWLVTESELSWLEKDKSEWTGTRMIFAITPEGDETRLDFTHEGLVRGKECYDMCTQGWNMVIKNRLLNFIAGQLADYTVSIEVAKSAEDVFDHIIHDVSKFWPEDFEGENSKLNDEFVFSTGDGHYSKNKVTELVRGKRVVWLVTESIRKTDNFDWTGSKMIFNLTPKGGHTLIEFTYDGVVRRGEYDRLAAVCDWVIKDRLYSLLTGAGA